MFGVAENAQATKTFIVATVCFTNFFLFLGRSNDLGFSYQDVFGKLRIWKLIASVFAFSSTLELMFGVVLLHHFRVFERQFGSNKYSLMWLTCSLLDHMASYMPPLCYFT